jgi:hypothetical protein
MTIVLFLGAALVSVFFFFWWKGVRSLNALERGEHGAFKVTRTSGSGESYLAVDAENKKLALANSGVPEFNGDGQITRHVNMTVVFNIADVEYVNVTRDDTVAMARFYFTKPIPAWNIQKELVYATDIGIRKFLEKYVPELKVSYYTKNQYGGVEPWVSPSGAKE